MQTLTFTQKLLRQRRFLSSLIPLFALFVGLGASQTALAQASIGRSFLDVSGTNTIGSFGPTTYFGAGANTMSIPPREAFQPQNFGTISLSSGVLSITNPTVRITNKATSETLGSTGRFLFRVFQTGSVGPGFTTIDLPKSGTGTGASTSDPAFFTSTSTFNLLNNLVSGGSYSIEITFKAFVIADTDPDGGGIRPLPDNVYTANFTVPTPTFTPAGGTTTWVGGGGPPTGPNVGTPGGPNDWNTAANWTNGIPTALSDAIIPAPAASQPPILNVSTQDYSVRNLKIDGSGPAFRGVLRITTATLRIYGNVVNNGLGILATTDAPGNTSDSGSAYIVLAGGNQTIDQGAFANVIVENNRATLNALGNVVITAASTAVIKSVYGRLEIPGSLTFAPGVNANLRTTSLDGLGDPRIDQNGNVVVDLVATGSVLGETTTASVLGLLKVSRTVVTGVKNTFGGIGIDITIFGSSDGTAASMQGSITRATGVPFSPVISGTGPRPQSIKRIFTNNFTGLQTGFNADVVFHYLNSTSTTDGRYNELNSNVEGRLELFRTTSGSTFTRLGGLNTVRDQPDSYPGNGGTVEQTGMNSINTLTLADYTTNALPLPVVLSAFDVKQIKSEALVSWATAMEKNSLGFYVEVSTDGKTFRSLGFVASVNGNSTSPQSYRFVDTEAGKVGLRYYRLHQVDTDGKVAFSPVRVLDFGTGSPISTSNIQGYPNPFSSELGISLTGASTGKGLLRLMDLTGRTIRSQVVQLEGAAASLSFNDLSELKAGMYIVQLTLPSGKMQHLKVQKQ